MQKYDLRINSTCLFQAVLVCPLCWWDNLPNIHSWAFHWYYKSRLLLLLLSHGIGLFLLIFFFSLFPSSPMYWQELCYGAYRTFSMSLGKKILPCTLVNATETFEVVLTSDHSHACNTFRPNGGTSWKTVGIVRRACMYTVTICNTFKKKRSLPPLSGGRIHLK